MADQVNQFAHPSIASSEPADARSQRTLALCEATFDAVEDAMVVLDTEARVALWNRAAEQLSGFHRADRIGQPLPEHWLSSEHSAAPSAASAARCSHGHFCTQASPLAVVPEREDPAHLGAVAQQHAVHRLLQHALGHFVPVMLRQSVLRDALGERIGILFSLFPADDFDQLPHGETGDSARVSQGQAEMQEWLEETHRSAQASEATFGALWITVDQGQNLRRTHGLDASEEMMQAVERALRHGLRPSEMLGRWGESEFLVISHERNIDLLLDHAHQLAGHARTADFRWWGDRVALTLSIGVAQWQSGLSLTQLLAQAQSAMQAAVFAGGNQVSRAHVDLASGV